MVTIPEHREYDVRDINGDTYRWVGAQPAQLPSVVTWSDMSPDTDMVFLHCAGDVFVNWAHVVTLTPVPVS